MSEKDNIQLAHKALAALNAHDIDGFLKLIDDAYVAESETAGMVHGREGARQMLAAMFQAFPDLRVESEEIIASSSHYVSRVRLAGTHEGTFAGVPATNRKVHWRACNVTEIRNGKAIRSRIYADNISLLRQLGVLPSAQATTAG